MTNWLMRLGTAGRLHRDIGGRPGVRHASTTGREGNPPRFRIIALPHAGGWPSAFRAWQHVLPADIELFVGQLPGRGLRLAEPPLRRVEPLVEGLSHAVAQLPPLPYAILGHSFGSVLAYELTKTLEHKDLPPHRLVVSARQPPCFPSEPPFAHKKTDAGLLEHLVDIGGISPELISRTDLVGPALAAIRADLEAMETYQRPMSGTSVPIVSLGAVDDPVVIEERLHLWALETSSTFTRLMFQGGHFYLYTEDTAEIITGLLITDLSGLPAGNGENVIPHRHTPMAHIPGHSPANL